jgi:two-component system, chemotaxis family, chemotaxis protein CheY
MNQTTRAVDDSPSLRQMVSYTFNGVGYDVIKAADGGEGLGKAGTDPVRLILTDQSMPKMDGLTLIRSLRELPPQQKTPILVLTTESGDAIKQEARAAGATGWMVKPFDPKRLLEVMKKVLALALQPDCVILNSPGSIRRNIL